MNVGLPGTGIGGMFYLVLALWMPFHLMRTKNPLKQNQESKKKIIFRTFFLVMSIFGALYVQFLLLEKLLSHITRLAPKTSSFATIVSEAYVNLNGWGILFANLSTLIVVFITVRILKYWSKK